MVGQLQNTIEPTPSLPRGTEVAVTGASGFIGGRLAECLAEQGGVVTALLRAGSGPPGHSGIKPVELDLSDPEQVGAALEGIGIVFHCAYDWDDEAWNIAAMRAIIDGCRANGVRRLVHASSFVVYQSPTEGELTEQSPEDTSETGYAYTKRQLERELLSAVRENWLPATILQPTIVYGPYSRPWTIDPADMLRYGTVILPDHGEGICNAVYVDDVISAMILAASCPEAVGERFLVSGPDRITWGEFYEELARAMAVSGPRYLPAAEIAREGSQTQKILRLATDPARAIRRVAQSEPGRRLVQTGLSLLPSVVRRSAEGWLSSPMTRWRRHMHLPNASQLEFLQSQVMISSEKARRILGYTPQFGFPAGMAPTSRFLSDVYQRLA
ncbi:MAG: NAD-dependent epimerase/dehydratase family protein [Alphaproteobacteria bacterium]|nr:NAD-dependent epimerase/dehydratase family protein [Alphaproteobacteria bacterium]